MLHARCGLLKGKSMKESTRQVHEKTRDILSEIDGLLTETSSQAIRCRLDNLMPIDCADIDLPLPDEDEMTVDLNHGEACGMTGRDLWCFDEIGGCGPPETLSDFAILFDWRYPTQNNIEALAYQAAFDGRELKDQLVKIGWCGNEDMGYKTVSAIVRGWEEKFHDKAWDVSFWHHYSRFLLEIAEETE